MNTNKLKALLITVCCLVLSLFSDIKCMEKEQLIDEQNRSMWQRPGGPEDWKDQFGNYAPPNVRKAADALWESVELEGKAAFDEGYGVKKNLPCCGSQRCFWACFTCGIMECYLFLGNRHDRTNVEFGRVIPPAEDVLGAPPIIHGAFDQKTENVMKSMATFKEAVNQSVAKPELYSGDVNICSLDQWIEDGKWESQLYTQKIFSCRRDMSDMIESTKSFVNSHGGWVPYNEEKPV